MTKRPMKKAAASAAGCHRLGLIACSAVCRHRKHCVCLAFVAGLYSVSGWFALRKRPVCTDR